MEQQSSTHIAKDSIAPDMSVVKKRYIAAKS